jgi:hypothetical protein
MQLERQNQNYDKEENNYHIIWLVSEHQSSLTQWKT